MHVSVSNCSRVSQGSFTAVYVNSRHAITFWIDVLQEGSDTAAGVNEHGSQVPAPIGRLHLYTAMLWPVSLPRAFLLLPFLFACLRGLHLMPLALPVPCPLGTCVSSLWGPFKGQTMHIALSLVCLRLLLCCIVSLGMHYSLSQLGMIRQVPKGQHYANAAQYNVVQCITVQSVCIAGMAATGLARMSLAGRHLYIHLSFLVTQTFLLMLRQPQAVPLSPMWRQEPTGV